MYWSLRECTTLWEWLPTMSRDGARLRAPAQSVLPPPVSKWNCRQPDKRAFWYSILSSMLCVEVAPNHRSRISSPNTNVSHLKKTPDLGSYDSTMNISEHWWPVSPSAGWRECMGVKTPSRNKEALARRLLEQTREPHYKGYCIGSVLLEPSHRYSISVPSLIQGEWIY